MGFLGTIVRDSLDLFGDVMGTWIKTVHLRLSKFRWLSLLPVVFIAWLIHTLALPCQLECFASTRMAPSCYHECWGEVTIFGTQLMYFIDMGDITSTTVGYYDGICSKRDAYPEEGVDLKKHPLGWVETKDEAGNVVYTGCEQRTDFPGVGGMLYSSHAKVVEELRHVPAKLANESIWRGTELGLLLLDKVFWDDLTPSEMVLDRSKKLSLQYRPLIEELLTCDDACLLRLEAVITDFVDKRKANFDANLDLVQLAQVILNDILFPGETWDIDPQYYMTRQSAFVTAMAKGLIVPSVLKKWLFWRDFDFRNKMVARNRRLLKKHWFHRIVGMDCGENDCLDLVAHALFDIQGAPGGLTIVSVYKALLYILFADTSAYGDTFPEEVEFAETDPDLFVFETIRFFTPVHSFPYHAAGDPDRVRRTLLSLAGADRDPNVWGADARKFRKRETVEFYHKNHVGFARQANDPEVLGGRMNRGCPGRSLMLKLARMFLKHFPLDGWAVISAQPRYIPTLPFVEGEFVLRKLPVKLAKQRKEQQTEQQRAAQADEREVVRQQEKEKEKKTKKKPEEEEKRPQEAGQ